MSNDWLDSAGGDDIGGLDPRPGDAAPADRPQPASPVADPTADLLRAALHRRADAVQPSSDGLLRIRRAIAEQPRGSRLPRLGRFAPALAAAAAVAVLTVAGVSAVRLSTSNAPAAPGAVSSPSLPVYVVGRQNNQLRLFREYRATRTRTLNDRVSEALTDAVNQRPDDGDYETLFIGGRPGRVSATVADNLITVELTPAMATKVGATRAEAELAVQQLVWTATAAADDASLPVRIIVAEGGEQTMFGQVGLDGAFSRAGAADLLAPVWIISLADGTTLGRGLHEVTGDGLPGTRPVVLWTLMRNDVEVASGDAALTTKSTLTSADAARRMNWAIDIETRQPGRYELVVTTVGSTGPAWSDSKTFIVN